MKLIVLIKEVPDMAKVRFDSEKGVVDRSSADAEINPFDINALQTAVDLKKEYGAEITIVTMGPQRAEKSLRDAYARGADNCVLLSDKSFGGSDTFATSRTIAASISKLKDFDVIICGEKSVDGDTAQVGGEVAEILDIPHAYYVEEINSLSDKEIIVTINNLCGSKQLRKMKLPALISVTKNINHAELPTVKRKLKSLKIEVEKLGLSELEGYITEEETGFKGSPTKVVKIVVPREEIKKSKIYKDNFSDYMNDVLCALKEKKVL
ncbi:MAG: electron transfer flavoprotein subunit beta/FixA family protein [Clostridia bacterium]